MNRILIAEDEERIASFLERGLRSNGFVTTTVSDGESAYSHAVHGDYDLLLLDIGLPLADGFTVLRRIREARVTLPVVILTARDSVPDTVAGLSSGADDYITKPFAFDELLARVRLRLRAETGAAADTNILVAGHLRLDLRTRRAYIGNTAIDLTAREFLLAEVFFRHPDQVLSREQLLSHVRVSTSTRVPTSRTSTSVTYAASLVRTGFKPSAAWAIDCARTNTAVRYGPRATDQGRLSLVPASLANFVFSSSRSTPCLSRSVLVGRR